MNQGPFANSETTGHTLIFDPVPFSGGSKIAVREILTLCNSDKVRFTVLTCHPESWANQETEPGVNIKSYSIPNYFQTRVGGPGYWFKQLLLLFIICYTSLKLLLAGQKTSSIVGISGPGVDLAIYLYNALCGCKVIQLIQGPVALSRSIGYCLTKADEVFYLKSSKSSIVSAIQRYFSAYLSSASAREIAMFQIRSSRYVSFENGLNQQRWPTPCEYLETQVFWAASLLKWKGLDILLDANRIAREKVKLPFRVCYIKPENTSADVSSVPEEEEGVHWYEKPDNLDEIRSRCSIFVSTSKNEPFGLSILESLAAGLCVVIPSDNAYWDQKLIDGQSCIKYQPDNPASLADSLCRLVFDPGTIERIGRSGQRVAQSYQASVCYSRIVNSLEEVRYDALAPADRSSA